MTTLTTPKLIGLKAAVALLHASTHQVHVRGWGLTQCVQIAEPFALIVVDGGAQGAHGEAGDWIVWHPEGYPTIWSDAVMRDRQQGGGPIVHPTP